MHKHLKAQFDVAILAHRGYNKKYPENTLLAFKKAIEAKADYIELDVRLTKDQILVVNHDKSTLRITGKNYIVANTDYKILRSLDFGQGEKIPTMEEVLDLCKGKIGVQIELTNSGTAKPMVDLVTKFKMENEVLFSSFYHAEIAKVKELNPNLVCTVLEPSLLSFSSIMKGIVNPQSFFSDARKLEVEGINPPFPFVTKAFCRKAHKLGLFVLPFTVDSPILWGKLIAAGADGIFTNDPGKLYAFLANRVQEK